MNTKVLCIITLNILLVLFVHPLQAIDLVLLKGDTIYSWAEHGLNIRQSSSKSGELIGSISYGKSMTFIQYDSLQKSEKFNFYSSSQKHPEINGMHFDCIDYEQNGIWIKILYGDKVGFVFSGYTSRFKPSEKETSILKLIQTNVRQISESQHFDETQDCITKYFYFDKGISATYTISKAGNCTFVIPNMTLEEAMLFTRKDIVEHFLHVLSEDDICLSEKHEDTTSHTQTFIFENGTNWSLTILVTNNTVIINEYVWC